MALSVPKGTSTAKRHFLSEQKSFPKKITFFLHSAFVETNSALKEKRRGDESVNYDNLKVFDEYFYRETVELVLLTVCGVKIRVYQNSLFRLKLG